MFDHLSHTHTFTQDDFNSNPPHSPFLHHKAEEISKKNLKVVSTIVTIAWGIKVEEKARKVNQT